MQSIDVFIGLYPPRSEGGRPERSWSFSAAIWALLARQVLLSAGWEEVGLSNDDGPIPKIVAKIVERVLGKHVSAETIARYFRSPNGRQQLAEVSALTAITQ